jgi:hypothetical protein
VFLLICRIAPRPTFERSTDDGKTWTVSFDGFYRKRPL